MRREKYPSYEERFCRFSFSVEKMLLVVIAMLMVGLFLAQFLLHIETFRVWFVEVDKLEGIAS